MILPPRDITFAEAEGEFTGDGLIPDEPDRFRRLCIFAGSSRSTRRGRWRPSCWTATSAWSTAVRRWGSWAVRRRRLGCPRPGRPRDRPPRSERPARGVAMHERKARDGRAGAPRRSGHAGGADGGRHLEPAGHSRQARRPAGRGPASVDHAAAKGFVTYGDAEVMLRGPEPARCWTQWRGGARQRSSAGAFDDLQRDLPQREPARHLGLPGDALLVQLGLDAQLGLIVALLVRGRARTGRTRRACSCRSGRRACLSVRRRRRRRAGGRRTPPAWSSVDSVLRDITRSSKSSSARISQR